MPVAVLRGRSCRAARAAMTLLKQIGIVVLGCVIAGGMAVLGIWQLQVYTEQGAEASAARAAQPPVPLASVAPAATRVTEGYGLSVRFSGTYDPALQVLVPIGRRRPAGSLRVVTGLRQADGSTVAVVRGWCRPRRPPPRHRPPVRSPRPGCCCRRRRPATR